MAIDSLRHRDTLYSTIEDAFGKVVYTYTTQVIHAGRLKKRNTILKWMQIIVSAISTGGFLGSIMAEQPLWVWVSGICSTLMLVLTAYFKDSAFANIYARHLVTSNDLWCVREEYVALLTDFTILSTDDIIRQRNFLREKTAEIYKNAPLTDDKSYSMAQKALKDRESQFFSREELNQMLPEKLRK